MTTKNRKKELTDVERLEKNIGRVSFASFIRSWRLSDEVSQTEFAKKIGISVQNLNDLEKGRRIPSPARAAKIAKKLNVPELGLIQFALDDMLHKDGLNFKVTLETA